MWIANSIITAVEEVAEFRYLDKAYCDRWNRHLEPGELRLMTGFAWISKINGEGRHGCKTITLAMIEAYHRLVLHETQQFQRKRPKLRVVRGTNGTKAKTSRKAA